MLERTMSRGWPVAFDNLPEILFYFIFHLGPYPTNYFYFLLYFSYNPSFLFD
jgi:hypothetical protein